MQDDRERSLVEHLTELRTRLIRILLWTGLAAMACYGFSDRLMGAAQGLIGKALPGGRLVFLSPAEAFFVQIQFSVFAGLLVALPLVLREAWAFVGVALHPGERRFTLALIVSSTFSFYAGAAFAAFVAIPFAVDFLITGNTLFTPMISVDAWYTFLIYTTLVFGCVFETPLVLFAAHRAGLVSLPGLAELRRYAIVLIFLFAGIFSPPDVFSQFLVAVPMLILFELGILLCRLFPRV